MKAGRWEPRIEEDHTGKECGNRTAGPPLPKARTPVPPGLPMEGQAAAGQGQAR